MTRFLRLLDRVRRNQDGATAIEYGLMAALISVAAITAMGAVGNSLSNTFNFVENQAHCDQPLRRGESTAQAGLTKLSITRLGPALSKSISSLLPSCSATLP